MIFKLFKKKKKNHICPKCGKNPFSGIESACVTDDKGVNHVLCARCNTKYEYIQEVRD